MRLSIDTLGDRYVLGEVLGHGGTAVVVAAEDRTLGRTVAIKLLADNLAADEATRTRFLREARTAARWSHPHIVQVYDAGEEDGRPYMVMECIEGPNLAQVLRERGPLPPHEAVSIGVQVCAGLQHAHDAGLVHRDVKPANILCAGDGLVKMTDFGIAFDPSLTSLTEVGTVLGTAAYLAPERVAGGEESPAEDIYSLGVCLYEMLTGTTPYPSATIGELALQQRKGRFTPIRKLAAHVPETLARTVTRCLSNDPRKRPSSAAELARDLSAPTNAVTTEGAASPDADGAPTAAWTLPGATEVLRPDDERTVRLRPPPPEPERRAWMLPAPVARRIAVLIGAALAALVLTTVLVGLLSSEPDVTPTVRPGGSLPVQTAESPPASGTPGARTTPAAIDPAQRARDLADWLRDNAAR